jgi:hypothetical protein
MAFQAGQSGNPGGRPKTAKLFRDALMVELKRTEDDVERIQKVAQRLVENAIAGETAAIKEIADRIDGKVPQGIGGDYDLPDMRMRISWISSSPTSPGTNSEATTTEPSAGPAS